MKVSEQLLFVICLFLEAIMPRTFRPDAKWLHNSWASGMETVLMPVVMTPDVLDKLFFLQRMTGHAPFIIKILSGTDFCICLPTPKNTSKMLTLDGPDTYHRLFHKELGDSGRKNGGQQVVDMLETYPLLSLMLRGLLRGAGRNESTWIQVDADTQKRRNSGPETTFFRFFQQHPLAEKQVLFVIISFLP